MSNEAPDPSRRRFLTGAATVVGGVGVVFAAVPFLGFLRPNVEARAMGEPVEVDVGRIDPGQRLTFEWKGSPIWVIGRSDEHIEALKSDDLRGRLRDPDSERDQQPDYVDPELRSVSPEVFVVIPICTHLSCIPIFYPEMQAQSFDDDWKGGHFCACHGSMFDMAGRVYRGVPAPTNLEVPPHRFAEDGAKLVIGEDPEDEEEGAA